MADEKKVNPYIQATLVVDSKAKTVIANALDLGGDTPTGNVELTVTGVTTEGLNVAGKATASVVVSDNDLAPENIKKDVNILGVVGTYEGPAQEDNPGQQ